VKIRYEVTVDDLLAFAFYRSGRSRRRRGAGGMARGLVAAFGLIAVATAVLGGRAAPVMLPLAAMPILFVFGMLFATGSRPNTPRALRRQYEELLPRGATGPREMELVEDGLVERTPHSEYWMLLRDVPGIGSDGERTFIYTGPATAYVIPHRSVPEPELAAFVEAVRMKLSESSASPGATSDRGG
jgi:hypothetical protein